MNESGDRVGPILFALRIEAHLSKTLMACKGAVEKADIGRSGYVPLRTRQLALNVRHELIGTPELELHLRENISVGQFRPPFQTQSLSDLIDFTLNRFTMPCTSNAWVIAFQ